MVLPEIEEEEEDEGQKLSLTSLLLGSLHFYFFVLNIVGTNLRSVYGLHNISESSNIVAKIGLGGLVGAPSQGSLAHSKLIVFPTKLLPGYL